MKKFEKPIMKKEFIDINWLMCIAKTKKFIDDYNLDLISMQLKKEGINYVCIIQYGLGVR